MQYVLDVASSHCSQDRVSLDCREDHESRTAGDRYGNRHQKVSQPRPTDRSASTYLVPALDTLGDISEVP